MERSDIMEEDNIENRKEKGNEYFQECQYKEAVSEYERVAELTSNDKELAEIYVKIGRCYWEISEYVETYY